MPFINPQGGPQLFHFLGRRDLVAVVVGSHVSDLSKNVLRKDGWIVHEVRGVGERINICRGLVACRVHARVPRSCGKTRCGAVVKVLARLIS